MTVNLYIESHFAFCQAFYYLYISFSLCLTCSFKTECVKMCLCASVFVLRDLPFQAAYCCVYNTMFFIPTSAKVTVRMTHCEFSVYLHFVNRS